MMSITLFIINYLRIRRKSAFRAPRAGKKERPGPQIRGAVRICFQYRQTSSPFSASTVIVLPSRSSPERIVRASSVSTLLCR